MSTRNTAVAGQFYPADPNEIKAMFDHYNIILDEHLEDAALLKEKPRAVKITR